MRSREIPEMQPREQIERVSPLIEQVREMVANWPFGKGTSRIASLLGTLVFRERDEEVVGRVGRGGTLSSWQPDEFKHPTFWYLYEKPVRRELAKLLSPGCVYVDIGAHRGWLAAYGLDLVSPGGLVIACEPFPQHAERLRALTVLNPGKRLLVENVAVSRASGTAQLLTSDATEGTVHTIVPAFAAKVPTERRPLEVPVSSLDDITSRHRLFNGSGKSPDVIIKIDAEGAERDILLGASRTLTEPALKALIIEVSGSGGGDLTERSKECSDILRNAGYAIRVLTRKIGARRVDQKCRPLRESDLKDELNILARKESGATH